MEIKRLHNIPSLYSSLNFQLFDLFSEDKKPELVASTSKDEKVEEKKDKDVAVVE